MERVTGQFQNMVPDGKFTVLSWNTQKNLDSAFQIFLNKLEELFEMRIQFYCFRRFQDGGGGMMVVVAMALSCKGSRIEIVA